MKRAKINILSNACNILSTCILWKQTEFVREVI